MVRRIWKWIHLYNVYGEARLSSVYATIKLVYASAWVFTWRTSVCPSVCVALMQLFWQVLLCVCLWIWIVFWMKIRKKYLWHFSRKCMPICANIQKKGPISISILYWMFKLRAIYTHEKSYVHECITWSYLLFGKHLRSCKRYSEVDMPVYWDG